MKPNKTLLTVIATVAFTSINLVGFPISRNTFAADPTTKGKAVAEQVTASEKSLGSVIDSSGRVKEGAEGSFDASGFKMVLGKNNEPTFVRDDEPENGQSVAGDAAWDARFSVNGITGTVIQTIVKDASGNLYIGGQFDAIGTVLTKNIAKWDGLRWSAMGTGADAYVNAIVPYGTDIYVAGWFNNAGGVAADGIAKWSNTSSSWSALTGGGLTRPAATGNDAVSAMVIRDQNIYVGGNFTHAGGTLVNRVARYNITNSTWHALGFGVTHSTQSSPGVRGMGFDSNGVLYVAGVLDSAGGVTTGVIAQWDGSAWSAVGNTTWSGGPPFAQTLTVSGTDVYVGGRFSVAGGVLANNIAKWNGSSWSALGSGVNSLVGGINVFDGTVYVVGDFTSAGGNSDFKYSAKWNPSTSTWASFATNLNSTTYAIYIDNTDTYIGGYFTTAGSSVAVGIAKWNGTEFDPLFRGAFGSSRYVGKIAISGTNLYAIGTFTAIGDVAAKYIARWDGSRWWPLKDASLSGNGTSGIGTDLAVSGDVLYVAGTTFDGDAVSGRYVARWNNATSTWSSITGSENRTGLGGVSAIAVSGSDLYVGGTFLTIGGVANTRGIARYDGTNWNALSTGITGSMTYPGVYSIAIKDSTNVFVGGHFDTAGGVSSAGIARWNPNNSSWSALGGGLSGGSVAVYAIHLGVDGAVYAGGSFTNAGATTVNNVAKWTPGSPGSWSALGAGVNSTVNAVQVTSNGDVYVGGVFTTAGGNSATYIARFSGGTWSPLGSGLNDGVADLRIDGSTLWVTGSFTKAGNVVAGRITRYYISNFNGSSGGNWHTPGSWQSNAVPTTTDDAVISDADVSVTDSDAVVQDLQIGEGRTLTIADGRKLTVHGKLIVQGQILGDGEIEVLTCNPDAILLYNGAYLKSTVSRCVNSSASYTFPVGTDNSYSPVVLSNITSTKMVTVRANQGAYQNAPARLPSNRLPRWWYINAYDLPALWDGGSGVQTFSTDLRFYYKAGEVSAGDSGAYKAWRLTGGSGGTAQNKGGSNDLATNSLIVQGISQFSDWTLAVGRATAGPAAIEGRVFDASGRPVANASVLITKPDGNTVTVKTNNFGRYRFAGIVAGETYLVMAQTRWNLYMPQVVTTSNDLAEVDFRP